MYTPTSARLARLGNDFTYHAPIPGLGQADRYAAIRRRLLDVAAWLATLCPESRELALATTKLEEAMFWANAAIARGEVAPAQAGDG